MTGIAENPRAIIGGNLPPSPYDEVKAKITELYGMAKDYLDGDPVTTAGIAAEVERLENDLKAVIKEADEARKVENKPFDDGKAEVQARYNELIGETKAIKGIAIRALDACKAALTPWKVEQQRIKDDAAQKARDEANRLAAEALAARQAADLSNFAEREAADALIDEALAAQKIATKAEKAVTIKTGLRVTYSAEIVDLKALATHVWINDMEALRTALQAWADNTVRSFGQNAMGAQIPGVKIIKHEDSR